MIFHNYYFLQTSFGNQFCRFLKPKALKLRKYFKNLNNLKLYSPLTLHQPLTMTKCDLCNKNGFKGAKGLAQHKRQVHPVPPENPQIVNLQNNNVEIKQLKKTCTDFTDFITNLINSFASQYELELNNIKAALNKFNPPELSKVETMPDQSPNPPINVDTPWIEAKSSKQSQTRQEFCVNLTNRFAVLQDKENNAPPEAPGSKKYSESVKIVTQDPRDNPANINIPPPIRQHQQQSPSTRHQQQPHSIQHLQPPFSMQQPKQPPTLHQQQPVLILQPQHQQPGMQHQQPQPSIQNQHQPPLRMPHQQPSISIQHQQPASRMHHPQQPPMLHNQPALNLQIQQQPPSTQHQQPPPSIQNQHQPSSSSQYQQQPPSIRQQQQPPSTVHHQHQSSSMQPQPGNQRNPQRDRQYQSQAPNKQYQQPQNFHPSHNDKKYKLSLVGDSNIHGITIREFARTINHTAYIDKFAYSGATTNHLKTYIEVALQTKPDGIIIHGGTNDILGKNATSQTEDQIACNLIEVGVKARSSNVKDIFISSIVPTKDHQANQKANLINKCLKEYCMAYNFVYVDNSNITEEDLREIESDRVHLSTTGRDVLMKNFGYYFNY